MVHWGWVAFLIVVIFIAIIDVTEDRSKLLIKIAKLETEIKMLKERFGLPVESAEKGQEDNS